jgi:hydrogenase maturation protease
MGAFTAIDRSTRLLGLGNELLADDAFGLRVAREVQRRFGSAVDAVTSSASGFHLLDDVIGTTHLLVVDTVQTGSAPPGTVRVLTEDQVCSAPGGSPHFLGLFDVLRVARELGIEVPADVVILAVEAFDCRTLGGSMHPAVERAIGQAVDLASELLSVRGTAHA